jgi:GNAT superfamily N-acetyltransferase
VPGYAGELNKLYVLRRVQRAGLGRQLLQLSLPAFASKASTRWCSLGTPQVLRTGSMRRMAPCVFTATVASFTAAMVGRISRSCHDTRCLESFSRQR